MKSITTMRRTPVGILGNLSGYRKNWLCLSGGITNFS
jgi:hypothetical protein